MPVSTEDCKKFLVDFFTKNPMLATGIYADQRFPLSEEDAENIPPTLVSDLANKNKWKRRSKFKPTEDTYTIYDVTGHYPRGPHYGGNRDVANDFVAGREFFLDENTYDSAVGFLVLEKKDGTLFLGDYVGD